MKEISVRHHWSSGIFKVGRHKLCEHFQFRNAQRRYFNPKDSFLLLVGFPIAMLLFLIKEWGKKVKRGQVWPFWNAELYQPATLHDIVFSDCTWHSVRLKRRSRQNDSHGIRIVMQCNSWEGNISMLTAFWRRKHQTRYSCGTHFLSRNKDCDNMVIHQGWQNRKIFHLVTL